MLAILAEPEFATLKADFHSFAGGRVMAENVVAHGCMLGMSGMVTFPKADNVREVIAGTPLDRFLVETDTPYLAPVPYRGKPNEPSFTVEIATRLGLELGLDLDATAALTTENFFRFFTQGELRRRQSARGPVRPVSHGCSLMKRSAPMGALGPATPRRES